MPSTTARSTFRHTISGRAARRGYHMWPLQLARSGNQPRGVVGKMHDRGRPGEVLK